MFTVKVAAADNGDVSAKDDGAIIEIVDDEAHIKYQWSALNENAYGAFIHVALTRVCM